MAPESAPVTIDSLLESASGDLVRVLRDLTRRLEDEHARRLAEAQEAARLAFARDTDAAVQEALANASASDARARQDLEARLRAEADAALAAATAETTARLTSEHDGALAAAKAELVSRLEAERADAVAAAKLEAEVLFREKASEDIAAAVAAAEQRAQEEAAAQHARATAELEQRLQADADRTLREATEEFERRLTAVQQSAGTDADKPVTTDARAGEREAHLLGLERLLRAVEALDDALSLREALDALAAGVAEEAPRSLLMIVNGRVLRGWRASCPSAPADFATLEIPIEFAGALGEAVSTGVVAQAHANAFSDATRGSLSFLQLDDDQRGLVVPVTVDGRVVAIVYADDGASAVREVPGGWPESIQVLARHAASVLAALTARRAAVRSLGARPSNDEGGAALSKSA
jgi:hypothetical protein